MCRNDILSHAHEVNTMRPLILAIFLSTAFAPSFAQRSQRVMLGVQADLIKSDNNGLFEKMQGGFEGSYYLSRKFAVTAGAEGWSRHDRAIFAFGGRFCPIDEAFVRARVLPRKGYSLGGGFLRPLSEKVRIEAMADFYSGGEIAIRAGMAYGLGRRP